MEEAGYVKILEVVSPDCFYVRPEAMSNEFEVFEQKLQKAYENPPMGVSNIQDGLIVVKNYGRFQRAKVLQILNESDNDNLEEQDLRIQAFLIDSGYTVTVAIRHCFGIIPGFSEHNPTYALKCSIAGIKPASPRSDSTDAQTGWSKKALSYFSAKICYSPGKVKMIRRPDIDNDITDPGSILVDLELTDRVADGPFAPMRKVVYLISQKLKQEGYAEMKTNLSDVMRGLNMLEGIDDETCSSVGGGADSSALDTSASTIVSHLEAKREVVKSWLPSAIPTNELNDFFKIRATFVDSRCQIYAQKHEDRHLLRQMRHFFAAEYGKEDDGFDHGDDDIKEEWEIDEACVARFPVDGEWYRATIVKRMDSERYTIFYIDFGHAYNASKKDLRLARFFGDEPALAIRFVMDGVISKNPVSPIEWDDQVSNDLYNFINYRNMNADSSLYAAIVREDRRYPLAARFKFSYKSESVGGGKKTVYLDKWFVKLDQGKFGPLDIDFYRKDFDFEAFDFNGVSYVKADDA